MLCICIFAILRIFIHSSTIFQPFLPLCSSIIFIICTQRFARSFLSATAHFLAFDSSLTTAEVIASLSEMPLPLLHLPRSTCASKVTDNFCSDLVWSFEVNYSECIMIGKTTQDEVYCNSCHTIFPRLNCASIWVLLPFSSQNSKWLLLGCILSLFPNLQVLDF